MSLLPVVGLALCFAQPPERPELPEGVYGLTCRVVEVKGKDVIVALELFGADGKRLTLKTTDASRFTLFDRPAEKDKTEPRTKPIRLEDLKRGQRLSVSVYSDGKEARLLSCVASGPSLGAESVLPHVIALGGKYKQLPGFPKYKIPARWSIDLSGTKAGDRDLLVLARLPDLTDLDLAFTAVTDEGLTHLRPLSDFDHLNLIGTKVTDKAVATLRRFRKLHQISVALSGFTDRGVEDLIGAFPNLELCRLASGKKGQFRIVEWFRDGKLSQKRLMIGGTLYAVELFHPPLGAAREADWRRLATTYYHRHGPVGQVMAKFDWFPSREGANTHHADARLTASLVGLCARGHTAAGELIPGAALGALWSEPPVAVFRLNAGTYSCYARSFQFLDFYDNTPALQAFSVPPAGKPRVFDYVHDARRRGANVHIINGPERPTLTAKGPKRFYAALFMDISREDLRDVNLSLMTKEGMAQLMGSVREGGLLCYHISHRYHDFSLPLADAAKSLGYVWKVAHDHWERGNDPDQHFSSVWFFVARKAADLNHLLNQRSVTWSQPAATSKHLWHDGQPHDLKPLEFRRK